ncbi:MAG: NADH-quinone oxidoreductase subunit J [Solirubrobacteraceae bacterium]
MSAFFFFLAAIGAITGAVGVVSLRDPFFSVLALVVHLVSLAALFLLLRAEFVAAVQVVVYAGAVMVLYVFVVAYVGGVSAALADKLGGGGASASARMKLLVTLGGGALLAELLIALLGSGLKAIGGYGAPYHPGPRAFGTPGYIGELLLTRFLLAFEIASFLLLVAAVGAVLLAGRSSDPSDEENDGPVPLTRRRPLGTGTMAEGVEGRGPVTGGESPEAPGEGSGQLVGGGAR